MEQTAVPTEKDFKESRPVNDSEEKGSPREDVKKNKKKIPETEHHYKKKNAGLPWNAWHWYL